MIDIQEVENIHKIIIEKFGGSSGIRDRGTFESALSRPFQTFDKSDLYPSAIEKAAALFERHHYKPPICGWQQENRLYPNASLAHAKRYRHYCFGR